eukprot:SAG31_NODE_30834_length_375_cov_1.144928_1_plen_48_part_01
MRLYISFDLSQNGFSRAVDFQERSIVTVGSDLLIVACASAWDLVQAES